MLSQADEMKQEVASLEAQIAATDKQIEDAERRQALRRRHSDDLYRRLLKAKARLEREEAVLRKPVGPCVIETMPNGDQWRV